MEMEEKRAIQPVDLYKLHALAEPQIASGGQFIAMVVISADEEQDGYLYDLHFIDRHSGQVSIISSGANKVRSLRFSPDGTKLAFIVTQEDNEEHLYVAETASLSILSNWSLNAQTPSEAETRRVETCLHGKNWRVNCTGFQTEQAWCWQKCQPQYLM